jgi:hypothetical protein
MEYLMHKISLLSEVSDVYEFFYNLLNKNIFCIYIFFQDIFPLPPVLSLIHSLFSSQADLSFALFEKLYSFVI